MGSYGQLGSNKNLLFHAEPFAINFSQNQCIEKNPDLYNFEPERISSIIGKIRLILGFDHTFLILSLNLNFLSLNLNFIKF